MANEGMKLWANEKTVKKEIKKEAGKKVLWSAMVICTISMFLRTVYCRNPETSADATSNTREIHACVWTYHGVENVDNALQDQGEGVFRLRNVNIVGFYYLFNCATSFGHTTIFKYTCFPRNYSIDNGSVFFLEY
jgi:hypothetical protein